MREPLVALVALLASVGCGAWPVPTELADARVAFDRAAKDPSVRPRLGEARRVLDAAEKMQATEPGSDDAAALAYAAQRKVQAAESAARADALREIVLGSVP